MPRQTAECVGGKVVTVCGCVSCYCGLTAGARWALSGSLTAGVGQRCWPLLPVILGVGGVAWQRSNIDQHERSASVSAQLLLLSLAGPAVDMRWFYVSNRLCVCVCRILWLNTYTHRAAFSYSYHRGQLIVISWGSESAYRNRIFQIWVVGKEIFGL